MSAKKTVPLYQRFRDSGGRSHNFSGVRAALKPGDDAAAESATWLVEARPLGDLVPKAGYDHMRDTAGRWWLVTEVGALADGVYPLKCDRWKDGAA